MANYEERYIGDGVYASFDGFHIILDLRAQDNFTRIGLEPPVFTELVRYQADMERERREESERQLGIEQQEEARRG